MEIDQTRFTRCCLEKVIDKLVQIEQVQKSILESKQQCQNTRIAEKDKDKFYLSAQVLQIEYIVLKEEYDKLLVDAAVRYLEDFVIEKRNTLTQSEQLIELEWQCNKLQKKYFKRVNGGVRKIPLKIWHAKVKLNIVTRAIDEFNKGILLYSAANKSSRQRYLEQLNWQLRNELEDNE